ncbi:MAG TPA: amidohydrolase [Candidatus Moranbacteria bacterium]|nr:amidohydrolase [Candidatus Moranbacteria bacterium]
MKQKFSLPLVNAHTHLAMIAFRGKAEDLPLEKWLEENIWPAESKFVRPKFVYENSKKAIREMRKNGIEFFLDMYFFEDEVARAARELKMKAVIGEAMLDFPTPSAKNFDESIVITEKLLKKYKKDPFVKVAVSPHSIYTVSKENLIRAKKLARQYNAIYHIHVAETKYEVEECLKNNKMAPIEYLDKIGVLDEKTIMAHCVWLTDKEINIIAKRKAKVVHCPLSNLKLGSGIAPIAKLREKGVAVALGTDGAASSNRLDIWEAGKFAALLQKGISHDPTKIPAREAVYMMTIAGMEALGIDSIKGVSLSNWKKKFQKMKDFSYLYELNSEKIKFW